VATNKREGTNAAEARLRSDAQRNKDEILAVAVLAFTKDANASLEGIARAAGVGIGTLYRHYPTRDALFEAAYRKEIKRICDAAPALLEKHRPDIALARLFDLFIDHMLSKRGMIEAMRAVIAAAGTPVNESLAIFTAAVTPLVDAGKAEGVLRDDVTIDDVLSVKGAIANAAPDNVRRLAAILIDGLRYRASEPSAPDGAKKRRRGNRCAVKRTRANRGAD
jgi:AcrR family transcriptional regulator